jgi:hypothetical protein
MHSLIRTFCRRTKGRRGNEVTRQCQGTSAVVLFGRWIELVLVRAQSTVWESFNAMNNIQLLSSPMSCIRLTAMILAVLCSTSFVAHAATPVGWETLPAIQARIKTPEFRARDFKITDYGAKADGKTDCTEAIRSAIKACHETGGGRVVVTNGTFLTAAVHLKSGVNLHIAAGATLKFIPEPHKYLPVVLTRFEGIECMNYSPLIYAFEQENIAITGTGMLDGSATWETWWHMIIKARETN